MSCKVRTNNGFHYVRFNNGTPYVYCGADSTLPPEEIPINQNFFITLIDEAYPGYDGANDGTGSVAGELWHLDVKNWNDNMLSFNNDACIVFDIGNRPNQTNMKIWPQAAVENSNNADCALPIDSANIINTSRPIIDETISQTEFNNFLKNTIESKWGNNFWSRLAASSYKLIIIVDISGSLTRQIIATGLDSFETFLTSQGVIYQEFAACANERWLRWITEIYNNPSISEIAPCGSGCDISLVDTNNNCLVKAIVSVGFDNNGIPYSSGVGLLEFSDTYTEISSLTPYDGTVIYLNSTIALQPSGTCVNNLSINNAKPCFIFPSPCYTIDPRTGVAYDIGFWGYADPIPIIECLEYGTRDNSEDPCPEGWETFGNECRKYHQVSNCTECYSILESATIPEGLVDYAGDCNESTSSWLSTDRWGAVLYCYGGQIFVHAVSLRSRNDANTVDYTGFYGYEWYYGTVPVNSLGYPDGQVVFGEPDVILNPDGLTEAQISGITVQVPNITFEYIGPTENLDINPCS